MPELCVHIGNFLGVGEEFESHGNRHTRTLLRLRVAGRELELHQDPKIVLDTRQRYGGQFVSATQLVARGVSLRHEATVMRTVEDLCWLLSLASMSRVVAHQVDSPPGTPKRAWSVVGTVGKSWPLIDISDGAKTRQFVEATFPVFARLKGKRRFIACIDALLHAEAGAVPMEMRIVTVFVVLEMLKDAWAREKRIPFTRGRFVRRTLSGKSVPYGFRLLLRHMFSDVGMRPRLADLVAYRNALFHSGGVRLAKRTKDRAYADAQRLAREYMLRRLRYQGPYVRFGDIRPAVLK